MTPLIEDLGTMIHLMQDHQIPGPYVLRAPLNYAKLLAAEIEAGDVDRGDELDIRINGRVVLTVEIH